MRTITIAVAVLIGSVAWSRYFESQFFPASDRPELLVNLALPQNASLSATEREVHRVEDLLAKDADVERFSSYVGSGAIRFYLPMDRLLNNDNISQLVVVTKDLDARDRLRAKLDAFLGEGFPEVTSRVMPLEMGPTVGWPLKYRVVGPDPSRVRELALSLASIVSAHPATREVNRTSGEPQRVLKLKLNHTAARTLGLSSQDVASTLAALVAGQRVTSLRDGNRTLDVVLRANESERRDPAALSWLQIGTAMGKSVSLRQIAVPEYGVEEPIIWRRQRQPIITVQAEVTTGVQPATVVSELAGIIAQFRTTLPKGYGVEERGRGRGGRQG